MFIEFFHTIQEKPSSNFFTTIKNQNGELGCEKGEVERTCWDSSKQLYMETSYTKEIGETRRHIIQSLPYKVLTGREIGLTGIEIGFSQHQGKT
jgi:hypothetical protein